MKYVEREKLLDQIEKTVSRAPITALLGPRQCGKTTISKKFAETREMSLFDLEDPADRALLSSAPKEILSNQKGLVIIDEIQRMPDLFPLLRVITDQQTSGKKFLILGSASPDLMKRASESLAGRIGFVDMSGFNISEVGKFPYYKLWFRGSFPRSFLAGTEGDSLAWRNDYIRTFLERDIPQLGIAIPSETLRRFWTMISHFHGQIWNGSEFARSLGTTEPTARRYLDILSGAFVVRQLQPWYENIAKRQVKSPKIYIRDSGILHALLALTHAQILSHPKLGASWEDFVLEQIITLSNTRDCYFWSTHSGAELDLLIIKNGKKLGFEIKYSDAPGITRSMVSAIETLDLSKLSVIYPGDKIFELNKKITVLGLKHLEKHLPILFEEQP